LNLAHDLLEQVLIVTMPLVPPLLVDDDGKSDCVFCIVLRTSKSPAIRDEDGVAPDGSRFLRTRRSH